VNDFLSQLRERLPLIFAAATTTLWMLAGAGYVQARGGLAGLQVMGPSDLAILIAAGTAPVAALWLVIGVIEQRRMLARFERRVGEMATHNRQSLQQAESQARTLMQLQAQSARAQAMETRKLALQDMAASAAVLAERLGVIKRDAINAAWARYGDGDITVFVQAFLSFSNSHPDIAERMGEAVTRDAVSATALATFVRRYERLLATTTDDKFAAEIFDDGALGRGFRLFKQADAQAAKLLTPASMEESAPPPSVNDEAADSAFARRRLANLGERLETAAPPV
jgi:hypothetical protein